MLLGMKKRGLGVGWWNGFGGKTDKGESVEEAAARETKEEIGVKILKPNKVAELYFYLVDKEKTRDLIVHVFMVNKWEGKPKESEEMRPKWFKIDDIPYNKMWDGDDLWIPRVLSGEKIMAKMGFNKDNKLIKHSLKVVKGF